MPSATAASSGADSGVSAPPPPPGAAPPTSHPLGSRTNSMDRTASNEGPSTSSTGNPRRSKQREIVVLPAPPFSSAISSHPPNQPSDPLRPVNSRGSIDSVSSSAPGGGNKLSKWLSRTKSSDGQPSLLPASNPTISISPSSSAQSNLSSSSGASRGSAKLQKRRGSGDSKTSTSTNNSGSAVARGFAGLTLKGNKRGSHQGQEELGEWANADLEEEAAEEEYARGGDGKSVKSLGAKFSLRRSRSNLRMFGRGGKGRSQERDLSPTGAPATRARSRDSDAPSISPTSPYSSGNAPLASTSRDSTSLFDLTSPPLSTATNGNPLSQSQGPAAATAAAAGRIGGWFNSILHSSTGPGASTSSSNLPLSSSPSATAEPPSSPARHSFHPSPSDSTSNSAGSPSKFSLGSAGSFRLGGGGGGSPKKGSTGASNGNGAAAGGRLGPLDRMLDKAVQYFLDTDSQADRCEEDIWVLGVRHEGWRPEGGAAVEEGEERDELGAQQGDRQRKSKEGKRRSWQSGKGKRGGGGKKKPGSVDLDSLSASSTGSIPSSSSANTSPDLDAASLSRSPSPSANPSSNALAASPAPTTFGWPLAFYQDFYSRIALTYRTGFPAIPCSPNSGGGGMMNALSMSIGRGGARGGNADGLTTDSGWGCMLRTGQSLLANTLVTVHLGRVHRFALMGKQLGKDVGEWFGPSTAAGAIKALVNAFEPAGLKVVVVNDGAVYRSEVAAAARGEGGEWEKPVLVLIGLRLGIDGVNPIYHDTVKGIFQLPQSVGIAGGRPSSSYYFVGAQANSLFYIDPHHPRVTIPLRPPSSSELAALAQQIPISFHPSSSDHSDPERHHRESTITDSFVTVAPPAPSTPTTPRHSSAAAASTSRRAPAAGPPAERVLLDEYFTEAYSDQQTRSYHCEKVRKMALASLDPSMLVGFLIKNQEDWEDFSDKATELFQASKPIFSLADSPPAWMRRPSGTGAPPSDATPTRAPHSTTTPSSLLRDDDTDDFSEPEDWELDSTDASAASSSAAVQLQGIGAAGAGPSEEEDEVESIRRVEVDETTSSWHSASSGSPPPTSITSSTSALRRPPIASSTTSPLRSPDDESLVVVDPLPLPLPRPSPSSSSSPVAITESESEEGWEGVPSHS
ncbi:hypothetical protein BCR35DRAFT_329163 [Leucosporidium creatinivorum]|uniref:Autophagy-related protein 4 n=1 Tax=Leucosporidium creatinivorum TaxID=106004 RepID=A0A1Y2G049_9BASI|nr:hypothetical protein BCR35DRAFT_329163 [Leucosporidium creatinivorum]